MTYNLSTLEKLLGRYYKWWYLFQYTFNVATAYRWSTLSWLFNRFVSLVFILLVWYVSSINGLDLFTFEYIFTYYVIGSLLSINNSVQFAVAEDIKLGGIVTRLLRPINPTLQWFIGNLGWSAFTIAIESFLVLLIGIIGFKFILLPASMFHFLISILIFAIGYFCLVQINLIIGYLAFFVIDVWGILDMQIVLRWNLSGRAIPLDTLAIFIPLLFLPYAFGFHHPMQVYLGNYDNSQTLFVLIGGLVWCIVLYYFAKLIFRLGLKKNESVGL
jgi:ABC-2 type transport system permease protein